MSEALIVASETYEEVTLSLESSADKLEPFVDSREEEPWGTELMEYVLANQYVIAPCPWMGGQKVTLGEAMWAYNYPPNMTENDVPAVWADVEAFLARRVEEKDETEENPEELANDEEPQRRPDQKEKPAQKTETKTKPPSAKTETAARADKSIEKPTTTKLPNEFTAQATEAADSKTSIKRVLAIKPAVPETIKSESTADIVADKVGQASLSNVETLPAADIFETVDLNNAIKTEFESVVLNLPDSLLGTENQPIEVALEFPLQDYETLEYELVEMDVSALGQSDEKVVSQTGEAEPIMMISLDERLSQIDLPIESIESHLIQVVEKIETDQLQMTEAITQILDQIAELPAKLEEERGEIAEVEIQSELEELFVELFDQLQIDYSPEIIESLARLTIEWRFAEELRMRQEEGATDEDAYDYGTHEIIKKLLAGLKTVKKIMLSAGAIGKSALKACTYDFPAELRKKLATA